MENTKERDYELYAAYRKFMNEINVTHAKAVALAVKSPASRYWVSPNYLYREIHRRESGGESKDKSRTMRKSPLYDSLYSDYLSIRERPTCRGLSKLALCDLLVNRPAPSFFISEKRADEIIQRLRQLKKVKPAFKPNE